MGGPELEDERMRKPRGNVESMPGDGWIRLLPGASVAFHIDTPLKPSLYDLRKWMNDIRSGVLSLSFGIENELILLALADEFGTNSGGTVGSEYFLREQEWREDHSLKRKIERVKGIIRARRASEEADAVIHKLAEYRELRNLLAHYPCWLEPVNREGVTEPDQQRTIALRLYIADRNYVWEVDTPQATEWHDLIVFVRMSVENIRREIIGAPLLNPDGSLPEPQPREQQSGSSVAVEGRIEHGGVSQIVLPEAKGL
jgi:hypothetical protein